MLVRQLYCRTCTGVAVQLPPQPRNEYEPQHLSFNHFVIVVSNDLMDFGCILGLEAAYPKVLLWQAG